MADGRFDRFEGGPDPTVRVPVEHTATGPSSGDIPIAPDWVTRIPEQYRANPEQYFSHVEEVERRAQEADQWREYGTRADTWIQWAQGQIGDSRSAPTRGQIPTGQEPQEPRSRWSEPANPLEGLDWDNPDTPQQALQRMWDTWRAEATEYRNRHDLTTMEMDQRTQAFQSLLGYYDRINRLEYEGLYEHTNYKPPVTRDQIAEYLQSHPGVDPSQARSILTEDARMAAARQAGIEEGRRETERQLQSSRTTTETTRGTPPRRPPAEVNPHRGYGTRPRELYDRVSTRLGRSDW